MPRPKFKVGRYGQKKITYKKQVVVNGRLKSTYKLLYTKRRNHNTVVNQASKSHLSTTSFNHEGSSLDQDLVLDKVDHAMQNETFRSQKTSYQVKKQQDVDAWTSVRDILFQTAVKSAAPQINYCMKCGVKDSDIVKCVDCNPTYFTCSVCAADDHSLRPFHTLKKWNGKCFQPYRAHLLPIIEQSGHECTTSYLRKILVVNNSGNLNEAMIRLCICEPEVTIFIRLSLWPSSTSESKVAYTFSFMEWLEVMVLSNHVSVQGYLEAVRSRNNMTYSEMRYLYRTLINESFEEYRHFAYRLRTLTDLSSQLDDGTVCPACPKSDGNPSHFTISLDANFGLVRKASAGFSYRNPRHSGRLFISDDAVNNFVDGYNTDEKVYDRECSRFQAGDMMRSKAKTRKLSVTGIFGSICKHEIPLKFLNMKHGERLAYPVFMLNNILEKTSRLKINVLYDIACVLEKHLKKREEGADMLKRLELAIPIFHCYGHEALCQLKYSPRNQAQFGRVDGEALERLWSFLRPFGPMTKEMTPEHRLDLLTDALLYYAHRKRLSMGAVLLEQHKIAETEKASAEMKLLNIASEYAVNISDDLLESWCSEEMRNLTECKEYRNANKYRSWEENYVSDILRLEYYRSQRSSLCASEDQILQGQVECEMFENKLQKIEEKKQIPVRWKKGDQPYEENLQRLEDRQKKVYLFRLLQWSRERHFLLALKKRHNIGQSIAERLGKQIDKAVSNIKKGVKVYNHTRFKSLHSTLPSNVPEDDAFNPLSNLYDCLQTDTDYTNDVVPTSVKRQAIDLMHRRNRAEEDLAIRTQEMLNMYNYMLDQKNAVAACIDKYTDRGSIALLWEKGIQLEENSFDLYHMFHGVINDLPAPVTFFNVGSVNTDGFAVTGFIDKEDTEYLVNCSNSIYTDSDSEN